MNFNQERAKLLELKAEDCFNNSSCAYEYKKGFWNVVHVEDYMRGKQQFKMINLLLEWGKIGYDYGLETSCRIDLSRKDEKFIRKHGIDAKYSGKLSCDWLISCLGMGSRDDIYGHMVKSGAFKNIRDENVRNWTVMGLLAGYAHIVPNDPMIEEILSKYDEKNAPTGFVKQEQSRGLQELQNGTWEQNAKWYHYMNAKTK